MTSRPYHTLLEWDNPRAAFFPQFGDYDRNVVKAESRNRADAGAGVIRIITTGEAQGEIEAGAHRETLAKREKMVGPSLIQTLRASYRDMWREEWEGGDATLASLVIAAKLRIRISPISRKYPYVVRIIVLDLMRAESDAKESASE